MKPRLANSSAPSSLRMKDAQVHYVEGCTAPQYTTNSLHSGVIEIIVKKGARVRYTTIQNWSTNVYNLVTQRAMVYENGTMEWVDANLGFKDHHEISILLSDGKRRKRGNSIHGICRTRSVPGYWRKNDPFCLSYQQQDHVEIDQSWRWKNILPRIAEGSQR